MDGTYVRTRADHDIAGLAMHVRLAYCLVPSTLGSSGMSYLFL